MLTALHFLDRGGGGCSPEGLKWISSCGKVRFRSMERGVGCFGCCISWKLQVFSYSGELFSKTTDSWASIAVCRRQQYGAVDQSLWPRSKLVATRRAPTSAERTWFL